MSNTQSAWLIIKSKYDPLWTVGFYDPAGSWHPLEDHETQDGAEKHVNYLNGGSR